MPAIVQILIILAIAIAGVLMITSRTGKPLSEEDQAKYGKIIYILVPIVAIAATIRFVFFG